MKQFGLMGRYLSRECVLTATAAFIGFWIAMAAWMTLAHAGPSDWKGACPGPNWCSDGRGGCVPCRPRPPRRPCC
jgi:hypothetical protein